MNKKLFSNLNSMLLNASKKTASNNLASVLLIWIHQNSPFVINEFKLHGFDISKYTAIRAADYYFELEPKLSDQEFGHFISRLNYYIDSGSNNIYQFIRDKLEQLFLIELPFACENCGNEFTQAWNDKEKKMLVYVCKQCGWAKYFDGSNFKEGELEIPNPNNIKTTEY